MKPTADYVRSILDYDPKTGIFIWRRRYDVRSQWNSRYAGKIAGCVKPDGYRVIRIDYRAYYAQNLAWLYVKGNWYEGEIDHRNLIKSDNRFENLRPASHQRNAYNRPVRSDNTTGKKGVCWNKRQNTFVARIQAQGKAIYLGSFTDIDAATRAYDEAARRFHGEFARPNLI